MYGNVAVLTSVAKRLYTCYIAIRRIGRTRGQASCLSGIAEPASV